MDGKLRVEGLAEVGRIGEFKGDDGGMIYSLNLKGWGWQTNYLSRDVTEARSWPATGTMVSIEAVALCDKSGKFSLDAVRLAPAKSTKSAS